MSSCTQMSSYDTYEVVAYWVRWKHLVALAMEKHVLKTGFTFIFLISDTTVKFVTGPKPIKELQITANQSFHLFMRFLNCLCQQLWPPVVAATQWRSLEASCLGGPSVARWHLRQPCSGGSLVSGELNLLFRGWGCWGTPHDAPIPPSPIPSLLISLSSVLPSFSISLPNPQMPPCWDLTFKGFFLLLREA